MIKTNMHRRKKLRRPVHLFCVVASLMTATVTAMDDHHATYIPYIPNQFNLPLVSSDIALTTVNVPEFEGTNENMAYEIVHNFDASVPGPPEIELIDGGPSLTIAMNSYPSLFSVCVVYKDLNEPTKYYGCSPFSVGPAGAFDIGFCATYPYSCYCDFTCIVDYSAFCAYTNYIPGTEGQPDFSIRIYQDNVEYPQEVSMTQWEFSNPSLSSSCGGWSSSDVGLQIYEEPAEGEELSDGWSILSNTDLAFDKNSFKLVNKMVDTTMAGQVLTFRLASVEKQTVSQQFLVTIEQDCSSSVNAELDKDSEIWLESLDTESQASFTKLETGELYLSRTSADVPTMEVFQIKSGRTSPWCEANMPPRYSGFMTNAMTSTAVEYDSDSAQFTVNWAELTGSGSFYITTFVTIENDDGLEVENAFEIEYALCEYNCQVQPNIIYLINSQEMVEYVFEENQLLNHDICTTMELLFDGTPSEQISWISYTERTSFMLDSDDTEQQGVHQMTRKDGQCVEEFKLSMCYVDEPAQITVSSDPIVFFIDTEATLQDGSEIQKVLLNPVSITQISDPDALQCELTLTVDALIYPGSLTYNAPYLEIEVKPSYFVGNYEITFTIQVESLGWSREYTIDIELQQRLRWSDGGSWVKLVTQSGFEISLEDASSSPISEGNFFIVEKNDSAYHYVLLVEDNTDATLEFFQDNDDGWIQNTNELWFDFSLVEIYVPPVDDDLIIEEEENGLGGEEEEGAEEEEPYVPVIEKIIQITVQAQYASYPSIRIENTFQIKLKDCLGQSITVNPAYNKLQDMYIITGKSQSVVRYEQTWDNNNGDLRSICFPYTLVPVWDDGLGGFFDIEDEILDWVVSFEQSNNATATLPISPYEFDLEHLNQVYFYNLTVQSEYPQTVTLHQKLVNRASAVFDPIEDSVSRLIFFQASIEQVWLGTVTSDDNPIFRFVRQPSKLDGTPAPQIKVTTFTNYDVAHPEEDLELVTEFHGYLEETEPQTFYLESDEQSLSLISDSLVDECLSCATPQIQKVIQRKIYVKDALTQEFIQYLESQTLTFTVQVDNCVDDFTLGEEPRIQVASGYAYQETNGAFIAYSGANEDILLTLQDPQQQFAETCGAYEFEMSIYEEVYGDYFELAGDQVILNARDIQVDIDVTMMLDVKSKYWMESFTEATFQFLECEAYFVRSNADLTIQTHSHSGGLSFIYGVDTMATITWEKFTYASIPCLVPLYTVTCTGPDGFALRVNFDGTFEYFDNSFSMCSFFDYNIGDDLSLESITINGAYIEDSFKGDYQFEIEGLSEVHDDSAILSLVFQITADCTVGANEQNNIVYLLNSGGPQDYSFFENTVIDKLMCTQSMIRVDGQDSAELDWVTQTGLNSMRIDTDLSSLEGLYSIERLEGDTVEEFKLSMCYLTEPEQLTVQTEQITLYSDTATALTGGSDTSLIEIDPFTITSIADPQAIRCEFTVIVESTYPGLVTYNEPNLEIEVRPEFESGSYQITLRLVVDAVDWSQDYTVEFSLGRLLRWEGEYGIKLVTQTGYTEDYPGDRWYHDIDDTSSHYKLSVAPEVEHPVTYSIDQVLKGGGAQLEGVITLVDQDQIQLTLGSFESTDFQTDLSIQYSASYTSFPSIQISSSITLTIIDCEAQDTNSISVINNFEDTYVQIGSKATVRKTETIDGSDISVFCHPYTIFAELVSNDGGSVQTLDESQTWLTSISQSSNLIEPQPFNYHELKEKQFAYSLSLAVQSYSSEMITIQQKLINKAGVEFSNAPGSTSQIFFYQASIPQIWEQTPVGGKDLIFRFSVQPTRLDGLSAPRIELVTYTNYEEPSGESSLRVGVAFSGYDATYFDVEQTDSTLSLVGDKLIDDCGPSSDCPPVQSWQLTRQLYLEDEASGKFVEYIDPEKINFTLEVVNCLQEIILPSEPRINGLTGTVEDIGGNSYTIAIDDTDAGLTLKLPSQVYPETCGEKLLQLSFEDQSHAEFFSLDNSGVSIASSLMTAPMDVKMTITISNDFFSETYVFAKLKFLICENFFSLYGSSDFSISPGISSGDLSLNVVSDSSAEISWTEFSYDYIPCTGLLFQITCEGPDNARYKLNADGSGKASGKPDSLCRKFNYEKSQTERKITLETTDLADLSEGKFAFTITAYSDAHDETASLDFVFSVFDDCGSTDERVFNPTTQAFECKVEEKIVLQFTGIGNKVLTPWKVITDTSDTYKLPPINNLDKIDISVRASDQDSRLQKFQCFDYDKQRHYINIALPRDWPVDITQEVLVLQLKHGQETSTYSIPLQIEQKEVPQAVDKQTEVSEEDTIETVEQSIWLDSPDYREFANELDFSKNTNEQIEPDRCEPINAEVDREGRIAITFNYPIEVIGDNIEDSGAVQLQLLTAMEPAEDSKTGFSWSIAQQESGKLLFDIEFQEPSVISASGNDRDQLRIFIYDVSSLISCLPKPQISSRRLQQNTLNSPKELVLRIEIPPQYPVRTSQDEDQIFFRNELHVSRVLVGLIVFSSLIQMPSQVVYSGILTVQVISHIPLNNLNLARTSMNFMRYLNQIVSFQVLDPVAFHNADYSETFPYNVNFNWLGYTTTNYLQNIGILGYFALFLVLRSLFGYLFYLCSRVRQFRCIRRGHHIFIPSTLDCFQMWIRFSLVAFFEFAIATWTGLHMRRLYVGEMTAADHLSVMLAVMTAILIVLYPIAIVLAIYQRSMPQAAYSLRSDALKSQGGFGQTVSGIVIDDQMCSNYQTGLQFNVGKELQMKRLQKASLDGQSRNGPNDVLAMTIYKCEKEETGSASNKTPGSVHSNKSLMRENKQSHLALSSSRKNGQNVTPNKPVPLTQRIVELSGLERRQTQYRSGAYNFDLLEGGSPELPNKTSTKNYLTTETREGSSQNSNRNKLAYDGYEAPTVKFAADQDLVDPETTLGKLTVRLQVFSQNCEELFADLKHYKGVWPLIFNFLAIMRRVLLLSLAVFTSKESWIQVLGFILVSECFCVYLFAVKPCYWKIQCRIEMANEFCVLVVGYLLAATVGWNLPLLHRFSVSVATIAVTILVIILNMAQWAVTAVMIIHQAIRRFIIRRQVKRRIAAKKAALSKQASKLDLVSVETERALIGTEKRSSPIMQDVDEQEVVLHEQGLLVETSRSKRNTPEMKSELKSKTTSFAEASQSEIASQEIELPEQPTMLMLSALQQQDQVMASTREDEPLEQIIELEDDQDSVDLSEVSAEENRRAALKPIALEEPIEPLFDKLPKRPGSVYVVDHELLLCAPVIVAKRSKSADWGHEKHQQVEEPPEQQQEQIHMKILGRTQYQQLQAISEIPESVGEMPFMQTATMFGGKQAVGGKESLKAQPLRRNNDAVFQRLQAKKVDNSDVVSQFSFRKYLRKRGQAQQQPKKPKKPNVSPEFLHFYTMYAESLSNARKTKKGGK